MAEQAINAKLSILVTPDVKRQLKAEARSKKVTVCELVRQRIGGSPDAEERLFFTALADLGDRAREVIGQVEATRDALARDCADRAARELEVRRVTRARLAAGASLSDLLRPVPAGAPA